jgi:hypothetical protein
MLRPCRPLVDGTLRHFYQLAGFRYRYHGRSRRPTAAHARARVCVCVKHPTDWRRSVISRKVFDFFRQMSHGFVAAKASRRSPRSPLAHKRDAISMAASATINRTYLEGGFCVVYRVDGRS